MIAKGSVARVRKRAQQRCDYCQSPQRYVFGKLEVDHIIPIALRLNNTIAMMVRHEWSRLDGIRQSVEEKIAKVHRGEPKTEAASQ
jgi:5-methylcytosine-specific restriction endonuclease McrA